MRRRAARWAVAGSNQGVFGESTVGLLLSADFQVLCKSGAGGMGAYLLIRRDHRTKDQWRRGPGGRREAEIGHPSAR